MLAGISHDLRTPLARLRLETEMSVADDVAREHMVADIVQLDAIIDKFLDYARPDHVQLKPVRLPPWSSPACTPCRTTASCRSHVVPEDLHVLADEVELARVISNLLENARRYGKTPDTATTVVEIAAKVREEWVVLKVRDHGPGVPPEKLANLTKPFFRGDAARTAPPAPAWACPSWTRRCSAWAACSRWPTAAAAAWPPTSSCSAPEARPRPRRRVQSAPSNKTTARASMLRPWPTGPSFSAVLAFTLTCSGARPSAAAMRSHMAGMCGASLGAWAITVLSMLPMRQPAACAARRLLQQHGESAPESARRCRENGARCRPAPPRPAGVGDGVQQHIGIGMAQQAHAVRISTPPRISLRPGTRACTSQPSPMRSLMPPPACRLARRCSTAAASAKSSG
jgi:hypothetical protein